MTILSKEDIGFRPIGIAVCDAKGAVNEKSSPLNTRLRLLQLREFAAACIEYVQATAAKRPTYIFFITHTPIILDTKPIYYLY